MSDDSYVSGEEIVPDTTGIYVSDWQGNIDVDRLRRARTAKARAAMADHDLGGVLSFRQANIKYLTAAPRFQYQETSENFDYAPFGFRYALLSEMADQPILWEHGSIADQLAYHMPWLRIKYATSLVGSMRGIGAVAWRNQAEEFAKELKATLEAEGIADEPIGIDIYYPPLEDVLREAGIEITHDGMDALLDARVVKTRDEIECIRQASAIGEAAFSTMRQAVEPGVRESEIVGKLNEVAYERGGESRGYGFVVASGPNSWPNIRTYTDRMIRPQEAIFADVYGIKFLEYHTCYYRTFVLGKMWPEIEEAYERTRQAQQDGFDAIKPGNTTADLAEAFPAAEEWGDEETDKSVSGNAIAHGIGLSHFEYPTTSREWSFDDPIEFEEDMVMAVETQFGDGKGQGVRLEDIVRVTGNGCEILTNWPETLDPDHIEIRY